MSASSTPEPRTGRLVRWLTVPFWSRLDGFVLAAICALAILRVNWLGWVFIMLGMTGLSIGTRFALRVAKLKRGASVPDQEAS